MKTTRKIFFRHIIRATTIVIYIYFYYVQWVSVNQHYVNISNSEAYFLIVMNTLLEMIFLKTINDLRMQKVQIVGRNGMNFIVIFFLKNINRTTAGENRNQFFYQIMLMF